MKVILVDPKVSISYRFHCTSEITYVCCKVTLRTSYTCTLVCITNLCIFTKLSNLYTMVEVYIFMFANAYSIGGNMIM